MDDFKILETIGEGAFATVDKAIHIPTQEIVALKRIYPRPPTRTFPNQTEPPKQVENIDREIELLFRLHHPNIIKVYKALKENREKILVMEYMPLDLLHLLQHAQTLTEPNFTSNSKYFSPAHIKSYLRDISCGLEYLHKLEIAHRDLKPSNILISSEFNLKIADFGMARFLKKDSQSYFFSTDETKEVNGNLSHQIGSRWYRSPESLFASRTYTQAVDLWALGCILVEMINGSTLFPGQSDIHQLVLVVNFLGVPNEENFPGVEQLPDYAKINFDSSCKKQKWEDHLSKDLPKSLLALIDSLICYDAQKRWTPTQVLTSPWLFENPLPAVPAELPSITKQNYDDDSDD